MAKRGSVTETRSTTGRERFDGWKKAARAGSESSRVLDWYCQHGCGALYVPIVGTGESFCDRFDAIAESRSNLRNQQLIYFDDVLQYRFRKIQGSRVHQEYQQVSQRIEQQIKLVDDLVHKRRRLPKAKPKAKATIRKQQREQLRELLIVDRDILWRLVMERPGVDLELAKYLDKQGVFKKLARWSKRCAPF